MKKYFGLLLIVICVLTLTACGKSESNKLIGTWTGISSGNINTTYTFKKDLTVDFDDEYGFYPSSGTYEINEDVVTIKLDSWSESKQYRFEIKDGKLSLMAISAYMPSYPEMTKQK